MSYTREQIIKMLIPAIQQNTGEAVSTIRDQLRGLYTAELEEMLRKQRAARRVIHDPVPQPETREKEKLIKKIIPLLRLSTAEERRKMTNELQTHTIPELQAFFDKVSGLAYQQELARAQVIEERNQGSEDLTWVHICRVAINGKRVEDNMANRKMIFSWVHPGETMGPSLFEKILEENPALAKQISWETILSPEQRKAQAAQKEARGREVFAVVCRKHNLSECEANFRVLFDADVLDSEYAADQAIISNAVTLAPATSDELAVFQQERIEAHNQELLRVAETNPDQLKARVREEAEARQQAVQREQAERQFEAAQQRDAVMGFPPLPDVWQGQKLDAAFIKSCSVETHKYLTKRFGSAQLTARLQGRD